MRSAPTAPEQRLWNGLRASRLGGFKFRRQATIGRFIVDFFCPQRGLIVEVDGDTHVDPDADARRDAALAAMGYRVVRVANGEVMANIEGVREMLLAILDALPDRRDIPHPNPSPEGEGLRVRRRPATGGQRRVRDFDVKTYELDENYRNEGLATC